MIAWVVNEAGIESDLVGPDAEAGRAIRPRSLDLPKGRGLGPEVPSESHEIGFTLSTAQASADAYSQDSTSRHRPSSPLDARARPAGWTRGRSAEPDVDRVFQFRRPQDPGVRLPAVAAKVSRPAAGLDRHPRRPRGAVSPGVPGPAQLPGQRAGHRLDLPQRARLVGLRQDVPEARQRHEARGRGQGHRRACSTGSPASPISTSPAWG